MTDWDARVLSRYNYGLNQDAMTDLYRAKYNMPLDGESTERFIATKVPQRKNKDYRGRFRSFSMGYPTYKKDNYMRHWYNFKDIMANTEAPLMKYSKIAIGSYLWAIALNFFNGFRKAGFEKTSPLQDHKASVNYNYTKRVAIFEEIKGVFRYGNKTALFFSGFFTAWSIILNRFKAYDYSTAQASWRASAIIAPMAVFFRYDRPFQNFWYRTGLLFFVMNSLSYSYLVNRYIPNGLSQTIKSEKFYFKGVSPAEQAKIEYEDELEQFTHNYLTYHSFNRGNDKNINNLMA